MISNTDRDDGLGEEFVAALGDAEHRDYEVDSYEQLGDATQAALDDGAGVVAVVGGDGSQRQVGIVLARSSLTPAAALCVVPAGSVNLLAQVLGIDDASTAASAATGGHRRPFDVARCNDEEFLLNATMGFDAEVIAHTPRERKERLGRFAFVVEAAKRIRTPPARVTVKADGATVFSGRATSVLVLNVGQRGSADFNIAPDAEFDDGVLDVAVMRCRGLITLARTMVQLARDRKPSNDDLVRLRGADLEVTWSRPTALQLDGDGTDEATSFRLGVARHALTVCVPPSTSPARDQRRR